MWLEKEHDTVYLSPSCHLSARDTLRSSNKNGLVRLPTAKKTIIIGFCTNIRTHYSICNRKPARCFIFSHCLTLTFKKITIICLNFYIIHYYSNGYLMKVWCTYLTISFEYRAVTNFASGLSTCVHEGENEDARH